MKKASEYQQHARECRDLAARATTDDQRQMLLKMAETWDSLARDREARVAQKQRLEVLNIETSNEAAPGWSPETITSASLKN